MPDFDHIHIEFEPVLDMATTFGTSSETLQSIGKGIEAAIELLKISAMYGNAGAAAYAYYLEGILPHVDRLSATCQEMDSDLKAVVEYYRDGGTAMVKTFTPPR